MSLWRIETISAPKVMSSPSFRWKPFGNWSMPPTGWNIGACPVPSMTERIRLRKSGLQQRVEVVRIARAARGRLLVGAIGGVEVALGDEERDEAFLVLRGQRHVERVLIDHLGHQLARVAEHVGLHLAQPHPLVRERADVVALVVEVGGLALVDEDLQRHAQLLAVAEHAGVPVRQPPRTAVVVLAFVEVADLGFAAGADLGVRGAAAHASS